MPVASLQPVLDDGKVIAWRTCDLAGRAMRIAASGSDTGHAIGSTTVPHPAYSMLGHIAPNINE
ncbi:hypothetical protein [Nonomuraea endophytica]|uniref:Uncharacterized protein n=1 Tax=Nonomuraea endophytica TaxID=714136 RepID=A0A7W8ABG4_9ACTN|nr:hypothetical protein [Nonomuraea endophytica]MBB5083176.1 hypothetical protein [Nonomuraea endophytica]